MPKFADSSDSITFVQHRITTDLQIKQSPSNKTLDVAGLRLSHVISHYMKLLLTIIIWFISFSAGAQESISIRTNIERVVQKIDTDSIIKPVNFSIQALKKVLHFINYTFTENESGYVKVSREFFIRDDRVRQFFYLKENQLIFAKEGIVSFYSDTNQKDSIIWGGEFYFSNCKLIDHVTLGHGKSELESWDPEHDLLNAFNESKQDIIRFKKSRGSK